MTTTTGLGLDLPETVLSTAAGTDLVLALAGALPDGHLLGGPVTDAPAAPGGWVRVRLPAAQTEAAVAAGGIVLRDDESTPLAVLEDVAAADDPDELSGRLRRVRARETGIGARHGVDLLDPALRGRPVLLVARPVVDDDLETLRAWAASCTAPPLVLVPEHSTDRLSVPADQLLQLAAVAADLVGSDAPATAPLALRDAASDARLLRLLAERLQAPQTLALADDDSPGARQWQQVRLVLTEGAPTGPLTGVTSEAGAVLRRWRPPRARRGLVLMLTGLSGSGKSTVARDVHDHITSRTFRTCTLLDGDVVRRLLSSGLGFDRRSRELNVQRIGYVAAEIARHGGVAICSPIAPFAQTRAEVRARVEDVGDFVLVHVSTPLEECERRDLKGLYAQARRGLVPEFTGISSPYEVPDDADLTLDTTDLARAEAAQRVIDLLVDGGWIERSSA